jgi:outer membrane biosynthesis protein TonB
MLSPAKTPPRAAPALVERSASTGRNPFARDARRTRLPRRAAVAGGGMLFALGVFTFLAWIQPDTSGERVETPIFRPAFKVERDPPPKTQQPERERRQKPPPKPREQKAKPKKVARTSKPRTAQRSTTSRTPRSSVPQVSGNVSLGVGTGGGGPVISVGGGEMDAALDEMAEVLERDRIADQIREREFTADEESRSERNTPGVAKDAVLSYEPHPPYPADAKQRNIEGFVKFRALIELDGTISEYSILDAQPPGFFEETVDEHVIPEMRFDPALDADGNPMPAWTVKTYRFQLKDY